MAVKAYAIDEKKLNNSKKLFKWFSIDCHKITSILPYYYLAITANITTNQSAVTPGLKKDEKAFKKKRLREGPTARKHVNLRSEARGKM